MGLDDRHYMRPENRRERRPARPAKGAPLWNRLLFLLWSWWQAMLGKR